jgi:hypothetical protein
MRSTQNRFRFVAMLVLGLLVLASPSLIQSLPGSSHYSQTDSQLVFFGTSKLSILSGNSVLLAVNLTNVNPAPINTIVETIVENAANNQTVGIQNSSDVQLAPSIPTVVNVTVVDLSLCTNYSFTTEVLSISGAALAPKRTTFVFPCEVYSHALNVAVNLNVVQGCFEPCVNATVTNTLNESITAVIFANYHSGSGETICVCSSSVVISAGSTKSIYIATTSAASGSYNVTVFVWDVGGVPISGKNSVVVNG